MISNVLCHKAVGKWLATACCLMAFASTVPAGTREALYSPLEKTDYLRLTDATERTAYLESLSSYPSAKTEVQYRIIGKTVQQRPVEAVLITGREKTDPKKKQKLRVMLLASQHGSEISGCEALLIMAGNWVSGRNRPKWMDRMEILIIPAVNPDGIKNHKRVNARGVNLSTDFGMLAAPESEAVNAALLEFKPHAVLDIHESALLKKKSLGAEGWLTDFEAQFEYANNPNVERALQQFSSEVMLPLILKTVRSRGLRTDRYIGEITHVDQIITHGGLSAHNFRNKAALLGAASFLVENRLDVSTGTYPTPRNIRERVQKQMLCIGAFLDVCRRQSKQLIALSENARIACRGAKTVWLQPAYAQDPEFPEIEIPLRRIDTGKRVTHRFQYRKSIEKGPSSVADAGYRFFSQGDFFSAWLTKQGIPSAPCPLGVQDDCIEARTGETNGCLLPLYLEQNSASSILGRLAFDADIACIPKE
jgi:hypothetical protein